ncbi:MAG TPA: cytochrome c [Humisphaera sp.]
MPDPSAKIPQYTQAPRPPRGGRVPAWLIVAGLTAVVASWIPLAIAARARVATSGDPRVQPFQDMAQQPKYRPQASSEVFADGRAMRPPVAGAVAKGRLDEDDHYFRGYVTTTDAKGQEDVKFLDGFPERVKVDADLVARGQQRFNIYCAACHGRDGSGTGTIHRRATELAEQGLATWTPPADLHSEQVRARPEGHIYNTINVGIRNMPAHGPQVPVADRWAIVAYVRALQLSRNAPPAAVPAGKLP